MKGAHPQERRHAGQPGLRGGQANGAHQSQLDLGKIREVGFFANLLQNHIMEENNL